MYNFDTFNEYSTKEVAAKVVAKLAATSSKSEVDIKELAYQVGLFVLIAMHSSEHALIVSGTGEQEVIINPLFTKED